MAALLCGEAERRCEGIAVAFPSSDNASICLAQLCCRFDQRVQHRPQIKRRVADHLKHVGSRGLLLKGFRQIVGALSQLIKQSRVFDRDDGLCGKVL